MLIYYFNLLFMKTLILLLILPAICCSNLSSAVKLGMWSWKQSAFDSSNSRFEMLDFCERAGISHIDQHVLIRYGRIVNEYHLRELAIEALERTNDAVDAVLYITSPPKLNETFLEEYANMKRSLNRK